MAIGTEVSLNKSKVLCFNTDIAIQRNITRILGFQRDQLPSKYLGIPLTYKPLSKEVWEPIINKLQDKIRKWTCMSLNLAGALCSHRLSCRPFPCSCSQLFLLLKELSNISGAYKGTCYGAEEKRKRNGYW